MVIVRDADIDDRLQVWLWANDPTVRAVSFNTGRIVWPAHKVWYDRVMADPTYRMYMLYDGRTNPVGMVRYGMDADGLAYTVGISVAREYRRRGYGLQGLLATEKRLPPSSYVRAYIRQDNQTSIDLFTRAGYDGPTLAEQHGITCKMMWKPVGVEL